MERSAILLINSWNWAWQVASWNVSTSSGLMSATARAWGSTNSDHRLKCFTLQLGRALSKQLMISTK